MLRALVYFVQLALVIAVAVWLAERPGEVAVEWLGYRLEAPVGLLLAAVLLVAAATALGYRAWRFVRRSPRQIARARADSRRRRGYRALTQGMVAVAAGDADEARRQSGRAEVLLNEPPLTLLLAAQTAQLNGDEAAARKYFAAMLERPETSFLGLRGLLTQALRGGDDAEALRLADRAHRERPKAAWAATTLLDLQLRAGDWSGAEGTLRQAAKLRAVAPASAQRRRAVLLTERARTAAAAGPGAGADAAIRLAREAVKLAPGLVPARVLLAGLFARTGKARAASKLIELGWAAAPHPALAAAYAELHPDETPLARARRFERLFALNPRHRESHLAVAEAALDAGLWGNARSHFEAAMSEARPPARVCRLMARLEEAAPGDPAAVRRWLIEASQADPDAAWICDKCGTPAAEWRALCGHCGAFDGLDWRSPAQAAMPALGGPTAAAPAALLTVGEAAPGGASVDAARRVT